MVKRNNFDEEFGEITDPDHIIHEIPIMVDRFDADGNNVSVVKRVCKTSLFKLLKEREYIQNKYDKKLVEIDRKINLINNE